MADINNLITLGVGTPSSIEHLTLFGLNALPGAPVDAIVVVYFSEDDLSVTIPTEKMAYAPITTPYALTDGTYTLTDGTYTLTAGVTESQNIYVVNFPPDDNHIIFEED